VNTFRRTSRRLLLALGGLVSSAGLVFGAGAGLAGAQPNSSEPGDNDRNQHSCFGVPGCNVPGFGRLPLTGTVVGGFLTGRAGGGWGPFR
jgi:hypothetical protein